jgi:hypothetical protein
MLRMIILGALGALRLFWDEEVFDVKTGYKGIVNDE